jgi:hypothetical protein
MYIHLQALQKSEILQSNQVFSICAGKRRLEYSPHHHSC